MYAGQLRKTRSFMKHFLLSVTVLLASCGVVRDIGESIETHRENIVLNNTVTVTDAIAILNKAKTTSENLAAIHRRSVAQIVFPKIVKAGFIFGANYGEGFLMRENNLVALIDVAGGNIGLQAGAQTYSQVTYILSEERYNRILNHSKTSISGTMSYAVNGKIKSAIMTTDAIEGGLYTVLLNETGTIFGASMDGLYYSIRK